VVKEFTYVPDNISQYCAYADLPGYNGRRVPCDQRAEHFMGIEPTQIGYCADHFGYMKDIIKHEVWAARTEEHWIVQEISREVVGLMHELERDRDREWRIARKADEKRREQDILARAIRQDEPHASWVYFVQMGDEGPVKIGTSVDVLKRVVGLSTASPYPLYIRAVTPGYVNVERAYHDRFADHRLSGEWFEPAPQILDTAQLLAGLNAPAMAGMLF
jgi:hypothetical protein